MPEETLPPLPIDIPWKRLCVTDDMIDTEACLARSSYNPGKWKPSIAVFGYEPPADQQPYDDMVVSYLKVTCTITGHQSSKEELGYLGLYNYWYDPAVNDFVIQLGTEYDYWACYGALLQVSVTPATEAQRANLANYPYFVDFQPKKRELYELVTQTGTSMSRSLEEVRVQKGFTTATNTEVLDNDKGIDWSTIGAVGGGIAGGAATGGSPLGVVVGSAIGSELGGLLGGGGDSGKAVNQAQETNIRTTDSAREKREDFSHTTQLTQMYHQLTSYHLGTNRALFYILPRPHIVQTERTFVNGPRVLEGIQEFMLVVMRPKSVTDICVNAYLETAHIYYEKGTVTTTALYTLLMIQPASVLLSQVSSTQYYSLPESTRRFRAMNSISPSQGKATRFSRLARAMSTTNVITFSERG